MSGTLQDFIDMFQCILAKKDFDENPDSDYFNELWNDVRSRKNLFEHVVFYSLFWKHVQPSSPKDAAKLRTLPMSQILDDFKISKLESKLGARVLFLVLPDRTMWNRVPDLNDKIFKTLLDFSPAKIKFRIQDAICLNEENFKDTEHHGMARKLKLTSVHPTIFQGHYTTAHEELDWDIPDEVYPIQRILHAYRNEEMFSPSYKLTYFVQQQMKIIWKRDLPTENWFPKVRGVSPKLDLDQLQKVVANLGENITHRGWMHLGEIKEPVDSTGLLEMVNLCLDYFFENPPMQIQSSYKWKHDIEELKRVYISNIAVILALWILGYGRHWTRQPHDSPNPKNLPVPLHFDE